ncbi:IclR family transcriptional regulator C-terminal domain-containing protein [Streptomyces sp. cg2]|uniref:IclR family transcriptional regulator domain-containing protein n=1 Tax=Streptomyces sp. cg2 TaxID=3238799 RepID=UPI0034E2084F
MSRYDGHRGGAGRPEPVAPAGLAALLAQLAGPPDFWDRPSGDFGPLAAAYALTPEERAHANSLYRLGSKALARHELTSAAEWLGAAAEAGHPGALFRLAALAARAGRGSVENVRFLVAEAARHGHGDAHALLEAMTGAAATSTPSVAIEDPQFIDEVREGMGKPAVPGTPHDVDAGRGAAPSDGPEPSGQVTTATGRLVPVPAPRLGRVHVPSPGHGRRDGPGGRGDRPSSPEPEPPSPSQPQPFSAASAPVPTDTAHHGEGLLLPLPPRQPGPVPHAPSTAADETRDADETRGGCDPWWSVNALRPAVLTEMARRTVTYTDTPQQWRAAARALDILYLVDAADGISTRDLARRSGLALGPVAWLLHWLRGQQLISTVAGVHLPGPLMEMTRRPGQRAQLLQQTLTGLRDHLGAAVYVSDYAEGDVNVLHTAYGPQAPPVTEWVAFRDTAHASAVGKSLLAQLDFDDRMNHLARHRPIKLTSRTITNPRALFEALDGHGPHAAQFDLLEYSDREVCAAFPLGIPGHATCVALSLPARQRHRLLPAAQALSERSAGLLMALMLTDESATVRRPPPSTTAEGTPPAAATGAGPVLPRLHAGQR